MECEKCSLSKNKKSYLKGWGSLNSSIVFVGEIAEEEDLKARKLLSGLLGKYFNRIISSYFDVTDIYYTTALKCRPIGFRSTAVKNDDIFICREDLVNELNALKNKKVIVAMGNIALRSLIKSKNAQIMKYRGNPIWSEEFNCWIFPTLNIATVFRTPQYQSVFIMDLMKIKNLLNSSDTESKLPQTYILTRKEDLERELNNLATKGVYALDIETSGFDWKNDIIGGISFCYSSDKAFYVPLRDGDGNIYWDNEDEILRRIVQTDAKKVFANGKFDIKFLTYRGIPVKNFYFDVILAHSIIDENLQGMHDIKTLANLYLNLNHYEQELEDYKKKNKECKENYLKIPLSILGKYGAMDSWVTFELYKIFIKKLIEEELLKFHCNFQIPLSNFLMEMELNGVYFFEDKALKLKEECLKEMEEIKKRIDELLGMSINLNSNKQLSDAIKKLKLKIPKGGTTSTGLIATSEEMMQKISSLNPQSEFPSLIIKYRKNMKIVSTFVDGILKLRDKDGRVHPEFVQHDVVTGRVVTRNPNLQGIPRDNRIRNLFGVPPGKKLIEMDYNAAEVRVWAHYINDENLINAFKEGIDIYKYMAQKVFGISIDQVTKEQRQQMKGVVLGLMYGRGVWSIADEFNMSVEDAQLIVNSFFQQFPNALKWMNATKMFLKEYGFVRSLFGRKRRLPGVNSFNEQIKEEAYRQAINFPIQSSTSDLNFLIGMKTMEESKKRNLNVKVILAIHDSLLFEADEKDVDAFIKIINEQIEKIPLRVPLKNDINVGECWTKT